MNAQFCWGFGLGHRKEENWIENHTTSMVSESPNEGSNLKTEKSQDYAQKPQRNSTVMNSISGQLDYYCASQSSSVRQGQTYIFLALCVRGCIPFLSFFKYFWVGFFHFFSYFHSVPDLNIYSWRLCRASCQWWGSTGRQCRLQAVPPRSSRPSCRTTKNKI